MFFRNDRSISNFKPFLFVLIFALLLLVVITPITLTALQKAEEILVSEINSYWDQGSVVLDERMDTLRYQAYSLCHNKNILNASFKSSKEFSSSNKLYQLYQDMQHYQYAQEWSKGLMVWFEHNDLMCMPGAIFIDAKMLYGGQNLKCDELSYADMRNLLFDEKQKYWYAEQFVVPKAPYSYDNVIVYSDFFTRPQKKSITICTLIRIEEIYNLFVLPSLKGQALISISTKADTLLYDQGVRVPKSLVIQNSDKHVIDGHTYRVWQKKLANDELTITLLFPQHIFKNFMRFTGNALIILMSIAALIILFSCGSLCKFVFIPLIPMINYLSKENAIHSKNKFSLIWEAFERQKLLAGQYESQHNAVRRQMQTAALRHALRGEYIDSPEQDALLELIALESDYIVAVFHFTCNAQQSIDELFAFGAIHFGTAWEEGIVYSENEIIAVLPLACFIHNKNLRTHLEQFCGNKIVLGWSNCYSGVENLSIALNEARAYTIRQLATQTSDSGSEKKFQFQVFADLENALDAGNRENVSMLLDDLSQIMLKDTTEEETKHTILLNLRHILMQRTGISLDDHFVDSKSFSMVMIQINEYMVKYCETKTTQLKMEKEELSMQILQYIQTHLSDSEMSLAAVADVFQLSSNYISILIKKQTGLNYTSYIAEKRMQYAMQLLTNTNMSIDEIATEVGYYYKNTFYKVFKRTYGNAPSFYRKGV